MNRRFGMIALCILFAFTTIATSLNAQGKDNKSKEKEEDIEFLSLEELVELMNQPIYGISKQEEKLSEAPMSVYQISKEEINRWGVRYLGETLGRVPGYTFYNTDYYGQYGIMARGWQSVWRYGYSIELMPIVDFGHSTFPSEFFGNMEAVRGPAGLAWGSSANAGLINTNLRTDLEGAELVAQYGNYNQHSISAMYGHTFKDNEGELFIGFNQKGQDYELQKDPFGTGSDWKINGVRPSYSFVSKVKYKNFKALVYADHNDHSAPQLWFGADGWTNEDKNQFYQELQDVTGVEPHDQLNVLCYRMEYQLPINNDKVNISLYHNFYNRIWYFESIASLGDQKRDVGFNANFLLLKDKLNLSMGGDFFGQFRNNMYSNNHKFALDNGIDWFGTTYHESDVTYHNIFAQATYSLTDKLKLIGGARLDYQDDGVNSDVIVFYRGGAIYNLNENNVIKYFFNEAPRRPQANERSNPLPDSEALSAHEIALVGNLSGKLSYNVTLYRQELKNQITRVEGVGLNYFSNTGGLKVQGVEWGLNGKLTNDLLLYWNGSALDTEVMIGSSDSEKHNDANEPLFVPKFNSFIGAEYNVLNKFKVNMALRTISGIPYSTTPYDNPTYKEASTSFVDLTIRSKKFWEKLEVSLSALNLLDNTDGVPAYGEHAGNTYGTVQPEGMRFYVKTRFTIPD